MVKLVVFLHEYAYTLKVHIIVDVVSHYYNKAAYLSARPLSQRCPLQAPIELLWRL